MGWFAGGRLSLGLATAVAPLGLGISSAVTVAAHQEPAPLVERGACADMPAMPPPAPPMASAATITVVVGPTVWLRVDDGVPVAGLSNSGCAPRPGDLFVLDGADVASPEVREAVLRCARAGDWTDRVWVDLNC